MQENRRKPKVKISKVDPDVDYGLYLWKLPSGKYFKDDDGNYLNIPARFGEIDKISNIKQAAAYYGKPDGEAVFIPGTTRATEEEYSEQLDRLKEGYIPSLNDVGAVVDAKRGLAKHGDTE